MKPKGQVPSCTEVTAQMTGYNNLLFLLSSLNGQESKTVRKHNCVTKCCHMFVTICQEKNQTTELRQ